MVTATRSGTTRELVETFCAFGPVFQRWLRSRLPEGDRTSYARMRVLRALQCHGPQIMRGLSDELGVTPRNVTALVDALEADHMVTRTEHPRDRRATVIELTEAGRRLCQSRWEEHQDAMAELFAELPADDQQDLLRIMQSLVAVLQRRPDGQPTRR